MCVSDCTVLLNLWTADWYPAIRKKQIFSVSWLALRPTVNRPLLFSWSFRASEWRKEKSPSSIQSSTSSLQGALWHFIECTYSLPLPGGRWEVWYYSRACVLNKGLWSEGYLVLVPVMSENKIQMLTNNNPNHQYHTVTRVVADKCSIWIKPKIISI